MKREWDIGELVEQFSLSGPEIALLDGKVSHTQFRRISSGISCCCG
jgi:hypothetical protein